MLWISWALLVISIGLNIYVILHHGHFLGFTWAILGFNLANLWYSVLLKKAYDRNDELWKMVLSQREIIANPPEVIFGFRTNPRRN